jgi:hypothetical protein
MTTPRGYHTATLLPNRQVLIVGGYNGLWTLAGADLYDQKTGTFTATSDMTAPRQYHTETLLSDGKVLVAGGTDGVSILASADLYQ